MDVMGGGHLTFKTTIVESANLDQSSDDRNDGNKDDRTVHPSTATYRTDVSDGRVMGG